MSTTSTLQRGAAVSPSPVARIAVGVERLAAAYKSHRAFHNARAQLMALDDRMLRDIGLDRSEIASALINEKAERRNGFADPLLSRPTF